MERPWGIRAGDLLPEAHKVLMMREGKIQ